MLDIAVNGADSCHNSTSPQWLIKLLVFSALTPASSVGLHSLIVMFLIIIHKHWWLYVSILCVDGLSMCQWNGVCTSVCTMWRRLWLLRQLRRTQLQSVYFVLLISSQYISQGFSVYCELHFASVCMFSLQHVSYFYVYEIFIDSGLGVAIYTYIRPL